MSGGREAGAGGAEGRGLEERLGQARLTYATAVSLHAWHLAWPMQSTTASGVPPTDSLAACCIALGPSQTPPPAAPSSRETDVLRALGQVIDPDFGMSIVDCGFVKVRGLYQCASLLLLTPCTQHGHRLVSSRRRRQGSGAGSVGGITTA